MLAGYLATSRTRQRYAELPDQSQGMRNYLRLWAASRGMPRHYAQAIPDLQQRMGSLYPTHHAGVNALFNAGDPFGLMTALDTHTDGRGNDPQIFTPHDQFLEGLRFLMESSRNDRGFPHIQRAYGGPLATIHGASQRNLQRPYSYGGVQYDNPLAQFHGLFDHRNYGASDHDQAARRHVANRLGLYLENNLDRGHPVTLMSALRQMAPIIAGHPGTRDPEGSGSLVGGMLNESSRALEGVLREHMSDLEARNR